MKVIDREQDRPRECSARDAGVLKSPIAVLAAVFGGGVCGGADRGDGR